MTHAQGKRIRWRREQQAIPIRKGRRVTDVMAKITARRCVISSVHSAIIVKKLATLKEHAEEKK